MSSRRRSAINTIGGSVAEKPEKPSSRITDEKQHVYERQHPSGTKSLQIGPDKIASAKLDDKGQPTIEVYDQKRD
jgi:hypothetical protein